MALPPTSSRGPTTSRSGKRCWPPRAGGPLAPTASLPTSCAPWGARPCASSAPWCASSSARRAGPALGASRWRRHSGKASSP
eukprot:5705383-Lingulodinium_polyedra.AAC.1